LIADRSDTLAFLQSSRDRWRNLTRTTEPDAPCQQERMMQLAIATYLMNDPTEALAIVTKLGKGLSSDSHFLVRGGYHFLNHILLRSHPAEAWEHGLQALRIYEENGWPTGETAMNRAMGQYARLSGHVREALAFYRRALQLVGSIGQDLTQEAVYIHFELAQLLYNRNHIAEARDELEQMILKAEMLFEDDLALMGRIIMNLCERVQGEAGRLIPAPDSVGWQDLMRKAMPLRQVHIRVWLVRDWILAKEQGKAWQAVRYLPIRFEESLRDHQPIEVLTYVSGYLARGTNLLLLKPILAELEDICQETNRLEYQLQLAVLQAWYWWKCADEKKAAANMEQALEMIERTGYVRFVLDIPDLRPLLALMQHPTLQKFPELSKWLEFSDQEIKILQLVAQKRKNAEIADELFLSVNTVKWYLWNIYRRLGVKNRRLAVARARELGLITQ
jgi:LuxR family maltose regulon positive regulatory protein